MKRTLGKVLGDWRSRTTRRWVLLRAAASTVVTAGPAALAAGCGSWQRMETGAGAATATPAPMTIEYVGWQAPVDLPAWEELARTFNGKGTPVTVQLRNWGNQLYYQESVKKWGQTLPAAVFRCYGGVIMSPSDSEARMVRRCTLPLVVASDDDDAEDDAHQATHELAVRDKNVEGIEHLGLTLAEAKHRLRDLQRQVVARPAAAFVAARTAWPDCGPPRRVKDPKTITSRTVCGTLARDRPRRRGGPGQPRESASSSPLAAGLPERTTSELR